MKLALLLSLFAAPAFASEPLPPPRAVEPCPACAKKAAAPVIIVVRPMTLAERIRERRIERLVDMQARSAERASRGVLFLRIGAAGGCR